MSKVRPLVHNPEFESSTWQALLTPSWLSGFLAVTLSLAFVVAIIVGSQLNGSSIQELYRTETAQSFSSVATIYHETSQKYANNRLISSVPLFVFWACLGLLVYAFAANVFGAFRNAAELGVEMEYANVDRQALLLTALERVTTRILAALLIFVFLRFCANVVVPYVGALSHLAYSDANLAMNVVYFLWALAAGAVALHALTVLMRLFTLRARLFSDV